MDVLQSKKECKRASNRAWYENNKERKKEQTKQWRRNNQDKVKDSRLKKRYNISLEDYNQRWENQNNRCAVCGGGLSKKAKGMMKADTDHCHEYNIVRGIIHSRCNLLVGAIENNPNIVKSAQKYITKWKKINERNRQIN
jgi:hypothetical protein